MRYNRDNPKHEDNLKIQLSQAAHNAGLYLHLEYRHKNCRFDAVCVRGQEIFAIIEIKTWDKSKAERVRDKPTEQLKKYQNFGVPVFVLYNFSGVRGLVRRLGKLARKADSGRMVKTAYLDFYPKLKKKKVPTELEKLIASQKKDMRYGNRYLVK